MVDDLDAGFAAGFALVFFGAVVSAEAFSFFAGLAEADFDSVFASALATLFGAVSDFFAAFAVVSFGDSGCFVDFAGALSALVCGLLGWLLGASMV